MKPVSCPNCSESNKIDSKFCVKCRMVLTYDAFSEITEEKESQLENLNPKMDTMQAQVKTIISSMVNMDQENKNKIAKSLVESGLFK